MSAYARRGARWGGMRLLLNEPTRIVMEAYIAGCIADARRAYRPAKECPGLLVCVCREETLAITVAISLARMSGENCNTVGGEWIRDLNTYLQGLS